MKDYTKVCSVCKFQIFSICDNSKGKHYKLEGTRQTWDKVPEYDTCNYFRPKTLSNQ